MEGKMRKIVSLANNTVEPSYENEVFSKIPDCSYVCTSAGTDEEVIKAAHKIDIPNEFIYKAS